jgi:hypothetical protein
MKKCLTSSLFAISLFLSSCISSSYFLSPNNANSNPYHAVPLQSDSVKGATYVSSLFTIGGANEGWRDGLYAFQARIHRSNNFGSLQAYYGGNVSLGTYHIAEFYNYDHPYNNPSNDHTYSMNRFFGSYGFNGGMNVVVPTRHGGEWRAIGLETSIQKEFGSYYDFRRNLSDSAADLIFRKNVTGTVGIFTDIISKSAQGTEFGYKMGFGFLLNPENNYSHVYNRNTVNPITYFSSTLHFTKDHLTGFVQINLSNSYAGNVQFGMNYTLGKK